MMGERLSQLVSLEAYKLAESVVLLSPFVPMLFMGDEYGETARFQYFISHSDSDLVEAVRRGRKEEFSAFRWIGEPPDPQDENTFQSSKLNHCLKREQRHQMLVAFHRQLLRLRKSLPAMASLRKDKMDVASFDEVSVLAVRRWNRANEVLVIFNFNDRQVSDFHNIPTGVWHKRFDSADSCWMGVGSLAPTLLATPSRGITLQPHSALLYEKETED
jgi:maltooligosyltrehalose trehalohydrolase